MFNDYLQEKSPDLPDENARLCPDERLEAVAGPSRSMHFRPVPHFSAPGPVSSGPIPGSPDSSVQILSAEEGSDNEEIPAPDVSGEFDEDFKITKVKKAEVLVHPRHACPEFEFNKSKDDSENKRHCEKCFCYICDIE